MENLLGTNEEKSSEQPDNQVSAGENTPPAGSTNHVPAAGNQSPAAGFWDGLPEDIKNNPSVTPFHGKGAEDVLKAFINTKSMVGADTVKKFSQHATWDDKAKFLKDVMGLPAEKDKYEVSVPEGSQLAGDLVEGFKEVALQNGVLPEQFNALLAKYSDFHSNQVTEMSAQIDARQKEEVNALQRDWGQAYDDNLKVARLALKELAGPNLPTVEKELKDRGWQYSPHLTRLFHAAGKLIFTEGEIKGQARYKGAMAPDEAQGRIGEIMADPNHPYHVADHPNHKAAIEEMSKLHGMTVVEEA